MPPSIKMAFFCGTDLDADPSNEGPLKFRKAVPIWKSLRNYDTRHNSEYANETINEAIINMTQALAVLNFLCIFRCFSESENRCSQQCGYVLSRMNAGSFGTKTDHHSPLWLNYFGELNHLYSPLEEGPWTSFKGRLTKYGNVNGKELIMRKPSSQKTSFFTIFFDDCREFGSKIQIWGKPQKWRCT